MKTFNDNDLETLSAYLDGILAPSESARVESRLSADPEFDSALADIRFARSVLRAMPKRKAPRNFMLTRKMVGKNPPMPRAYSFFKFASAFASVLLIFTFAVNARINSRVSVGANAPAVAEASAAEYPAAESLGFEAPATEAPAIEMIAPLVAPTSEGVAADAQTQPPAENQPEASEKSAPQEQPAVKSEAAIPVAWQIVLVGVVLSSLLIMFALREHAKRKWL